MNQREEDDLDNYITGHYGKDQFDGDDEDELCEYCGEPLEDGLCTGNCEESLLESGIEDDILGPTGEI